MFFRRVSARNDKIILNWIEKKQILPRPILVYDLEFDRPDFTKEIPVRIQVTFTVSFRDILERT